MKPSATVNNFSAGVNRSGISHTKIKLYFLAFFLIFPFITKAQNTQANIDSGLASVRGNYKVFETLNPGPKAPNLAADKLVFPFDQAWADKVLSVKPVYLTNISLKDFKIPEPPANSSDQTRAELNYLLKLQYSRTLEDITTSIYMSNNPESPSDIGQQIGYWADPQKLPATDSLMDRVEKDGDFFLWSLKFKYARVRPYVVEPKIHDLEESLASSYPSGHVVYAYIRAFIYEELAPEFKDYFIAKAYAMARARQIMGVHYPSDCEGSRIFARQFVNMLFENAKFRHDFEEVKKEWSAKRKESFDNALEPLKM